VYEPTVRTVADDSKAQMCTTESINININIHYVNFNLKVGNLDSFYDPVRLTCSYPLETGKVVRQSYRNTEDHEWIASFQLEEA